MFKSIWQYRELLAGLLALHLWQRPIFPLPSLLFTNNYVNVVRVKMFMFMDVHVHGCSCALACMCMYLLVCVSCVGAPAKAFHEAVSCGKGRSSMHTNTHRTLAAT